MALFRDSGTPFVKDGVATFICNDGESEVWLREAVPTIELGDGTLARIVLPEELIKRVNVTALVPPPRREASQLVKLLGRQNPELGTSKWRVLQCLERSSACLLRLGVDEATLGVLEARGVKAFLGTSEVTFKWSSKNPEGEDAKGKQDDEAADQQ